MELWKNFDRLVVFDTETTGIEFGRDRIIEIGAVALENGAERGNFNALVRLPAGQMLPTFITELTGITDEQLDREGVDGRAAAEGFCRLLEGAERPLLVAYNAQFDLNFLYYLLKPLGLVSVLRKPRFLDALTVYRDRRDYPHKLCNAIEAYGLTEAENSHRAVDDAIAAKCLYDCLRGQFLEGHEAYFAPGELIYEVKRENPATAAQKRYLNDLIKYHKIAIDYAVDQLTKNEASRKIDQILLTYGRIR